MELAGCCVDLVSKVEHFCAPASHHQVWPPQLVSKSMIHLASLRSVVRRLGLRSLVSPLVTLIEEWRFRQLGRYQVEQTTPGTLVFTGFGRQVSMSGLPRAQCELGLSSHERATILAVLSRTSSGDCVWDVGANVGFYTRLLSAVVAESGRVFAFEPNASTFKNCKSMWPAWAMSRRSARA